MSATPSGAATKADDKTGKTRNGKPWVPLCEREKLPLIHIMAICGAMLSFQCAYTVEFAIGTPMMTGLGIPQWATTVIWLVGPLSGFFVQPLIGFYSDTCMNRFGRRRPFIVSGTIGIAIGFVLLYLTEIIGNAIGGHDADDQKAARIVVFIIGLLITNVSINVVQSPSRTLVADVVPQSQQKFANSFASFMLGVATVITDAVGGFYPADREPIGTPQIMFIVGGCLIVIGVIITCLVTPEEPLLEKPVKQGPFKELGAAVRTMPPAVFRISMLIGLSWMAFMPFQIQLSDFFGCVPFKGDSKAHKGTDAKKRYDAGVAFGILVNGVANILTMIWSPIQPILMKKMGLKWFYAMSQIIEACVLLPMFWVTNKWGALALMAPMGIACQAFNSVPYAVVALSVGPDQVGTYMGVLNSFLVIGQQISNFVIGSGIGAAVGNHKGYILGSGSVFAVISAIYCYWIIVPEAGDEASGAGGESAGTMSVPESV